MFEALQKSVVRTVVNKKNCIGLGTHCWIFLQRSTAVVRTDLLTYHHFSTRMSAAVIRRGTTEIFAGVSVIRHCVTATHSSRWPVASRTNGTDSPRRPYLRTADLKPVRCPSRTTRFMEDHRWPRMTPKLDSTSPGTRSRFTTADRISGIPITDLFVCVFLFQVFIFYFFHNLYCFVFISVYVMLLLAVLVTMVLLLLINLVWFGTLGCHRRNPYVPRNPG